MQQLVAGAAQVGPQGAAQLGAQVEPQVEPQLWACHSLIFGMQSFGILMRRHRGLQQLLQQLATGAEQLGAQAGAQAGAAQVGAQAGAQAGAAQAGAHAGAQAGAAQLGAQAGAAQLGAAETQLLQLWWNRPA